MRVVVVNAGSSTVKLRAIDEDGSVVDSSDLGPPGDDLADQLGEFLAGVDDAGATGHRVVHGGERFTGPVVVDDEIRDGLEALDDLAPLHNPAAVAGIDAARRLRPDLPAVACFDTAFHAGLPPAASTYALPADWAPWGVRRYGFHGLSCRWSTDTAATLLDRPVGDLRLVIAHLGGGASVTAVAGGQSVGTSMGFTPLEGLVMATRSGDLDPGALLWLLGRPGIDVEGAYDALEHRAGLLGLSGGRTSDLRELTALRDGGDEAAALAVEVWAHRLRSHIAAMAAAGEGLDALVFTAGIGENSAVLRAEVCDRLSWLGIHLDPVANAAVGNDDVEISVPGSPVRTLVVHAKEELVIAAECRQVLT